MFRGSGARVSAAARRGAAPYADGCEPFSGSSHLISLLLLSGGKRSEGGILHNFLCRARWHPCPSVPHSPTSSDQKRPFQMDSCNIMHTLSGPPVAARSWGKALGSSLPHSRFSPEQKKGRWSIGRDSDPLRRDCFDGRWSTGPGIVTPPIHS